MKVDLREGLNKGKPTGDTNLFDHGWTPPSLLFRNDQLERVISCLEKRLMMVEAGIDTLNEAEQFALVILVRQYTYMTGKELSP